MDIVAKNSPTSYHLLRLTHVAFMPGFLTSLIGLSRCRTEDIHFNSGADLMYQTTSPTRSRTTIAILDYNGGHWLLDADPSCRPHIQDLDHKLSSFGTSLRKSYAPKSDSVITKVDAHTVWGHPSKKAVEHLPANTKGISLIPGDFPDCLCDTCIQSKMTQIISRRPSDSKATRPFYRIAIDLIYIVKRGKEWECWNGDRYGFHAVDEFSKWHELETFPDKTKPTMMRWFRALIHRIQRVFQFDVVIVHTDGE